MNFVNLLNAMLGPVTTIVRTIFGSREARDTSAAAENAGAMQQYAAEFASRPERNWFDSLVDGLNRLQRPTYTFSTLALFWLAYKKPSQFAEIMAALALIPEPFWVITGMIVGFLFSSRMIEKLPVQAAFKGITPEQLQRIQEAQAKKPVADDSLPWRVENPSIAAWKASQTTILHNTAGHL